MRYFVIEPRTLSYTAKCTERAQIVHEGKPQETQKTQKTKITKPRKRVHIARCQWTSLGERMGGQESDLLSNNNAQCSTPCNCEKNSI